MKCPVCGSKEYQSSKRGYVCLDCGIRFKEPINNHQISRREGDAHIG